MGNQPGPDPFRLRAIIREIRDALGDEIDRVEGLLDQLVPVANAASTAISNSDAVHTALAARISALEVAMTVNQTADQQRDTLITALTARATNDEQQIVALQGRVTTDEANLTSLMSRQASDEATLGTLQAQENADATAIAGLQASIANAQQLITALQAKTVVLHHVEVALPAIVLGGSSDVVITWPSAFKDATYVIDPPLVPAFLGKATATVKAGTQIATQVTVTVKATSLAITAGSVLDVLAYRFAA